MTSRNRDNLDLPAAVKHVIKGVKVVPMGMANVFTSVKKPLFFLPVISELILRRIK